MIVHSSDPPILAVPAPTRNHEAPPMLLPLALLAALHAPVDSVPGKWQIKGDVMGNPLDETCTITQTGTTLGGSCTNSNGGPYEVTGEAKDGKVTFKHGGDYQGTALTIIYSGALA